MDLQKLEGQIQTAQMLIQLGLATVEQIRQFFSTQTDDDAVLASLMTEVNARIARREAGPSYPRDEATDQNG